MTKELKVGDRVQVISRESTFYGRTGTVAEYRNTVNKTDVSLVCVRMGLDSLLFAPSELALYIPPTRAEMESYIPRIGPTVTERLTAIESALKGITDRLDAMATSTDNSEPVKRPRITIAEVGFTGWQLTFPQYVRDDTEENRAELERIISDYAALGGLKNLKVVSA